MPVLQETSLKQMLGYAQHFGIVRKTNVGYTRFDGGKTDFRAISFGNEAVKVYGKRLDKLFLFRTLMQVLGVSISAAGSTHTKALQSQKK